MEIAGLEGLEKGIAHVWVEESSFPGEINRQGRKQQRPRLKARDPAES
jgi:hypothetical protein